MKFKRKIRQPKKAKKVTLARIRNIVKEVISESFPPLAYVIKSEEELEKELARSIHQHGRTAYNGEENPMMYFPPSPIKPVPPPPRVSAKRIADIPPIALPDEHEIEEEKI